GEVVLTVRLVARQDDEVELAFAVRDTGIGISAAQQARMFEAFSQGDSSTSRRFGGTGLGLAICRRLVHLMGGSIRVRSEPGQGAEFTVHVRLGAAGDSQAPALPDGPARRILVVDDHPVVRHALAAQCRALGWAADTASGGEDALARLRAAHTSAPYGFLLTDSAMPGMDGVTLLT
ncbi:MAG: ATP-binding protein, partial [Gammaproteobacteria bacterium]